MEGPEIYKEARFFQLEKSSLEALGKTVFII